MKRTQKSAARNCMAGNYIFSCASYTYLKTVAVKIYKKIKKMPFRLFKIKNFFYSWFMASII